MRRTARPDCTVPHIALPQNREPTGDPRGPDLLAAACCVAAAVAPYRIQYMSMSIRNLLNRRAGICRARDLCPRQAAREQSLSAVKCTIRQVVPGGGTVE